MLLNPTPVIVIPAADVLPVVEAALVFPVVAEAVFDAVADAVPSVAVERLGSEEAAEATIAKATATAADCCISLMMYVRMSKGL